MPRKKATFTKKKAPKKAILDPLEGFESDSDIEK